ncbi:hypothetical protein [Hyphomicrobium sp. LHD-15]|uniref:hypothetical protein n=1 Tax=Hyphomicrobium sp. LHD-15 TaxID=3072142 RepID=UPI0028100732|nr:hypothetical protein [Hyphomicrobium sp. LHD-15]MDQ8698868.1 hypothetical protein [Hyphomicrobium sp. LHD-15]
MCELSAVFMFVMAHLVAWHALGGGWRGAARAPFAVMVPAVALLVLNAVFYDSYQGLLLRLWALISWEFLYLFGYVTLRMMMRSTPVRS